MVKGIEGWRRDTERQLRACVWASGVRITAGGDQRVWDIGATATKDKVSHTHTHTRAHAFTPQWGPNTHTRSHAHTLLPSERNQSIEEAEEGRKIKVRKTVSSTYQDRSFLEDQWEKVPFGKLRSIMPSLYIDGQQLSGVVWHWAREGSLQVQQTEPFLQAA